VDADDDEKLPKLDSAPPSSGEHDEPEEGATAISELPADVYLRAAEAAEAREAAAGLDEVEAELELDEEERQRSAAPTAPPVASHREPSVRIQALRVPRVTLDDDDPEEEVDAFAPTRLHDVLTGAEVAPTPQLSQEITPAHASVDPMFPPPNGIRADAAAPIPPAPVPPSGSAPLRPPPSSHTYGIPPPLQAKHWPEPAFLSSVEAAPPSGVPWAIGGLLVGLLIMGLIGSLIYSLVHH